MSVRIGLARDETTLDEVFRLRHDVLVGEGVVAPRWTGRIVDRFDTFPSVVNVIASVGDEIVGAVRFMEYSEAGASADDYFDFGSHLPADGRVGCCSQLVVRAAFRPVPGLIFSMMAQGYAWCIQRGLTHLTGAANPDVMPVFEKSGWKRIGDPFHHQGSGLRVQPGVLVVDELNERFKAFQRQQRIEHVFSDFDRVLYREGEFLCRAGEVAEHVFVVVDGQLRVTSESGQELARLGPSQVVGEVALLTAQRRTANVQAVEDTWLMMLSRTDFNRQLAERPEAARLVLELLAHRFAGLIRELDESR